jgi:sigma-B regulation protein RsbU (phosphoserine phosphatase)
MDQKSQDLGTTFTPLQIGSITTVVEPLNASSNVEWALEMIADRPEVDVVPIERNGAVRGVVLRSELEKLAGSAWSRFWQKDLDSYIIPIKDVVDATAHISRLTAEALKTERGDRAVWYQVQYRRSYLGIVSLQQMIEYQNKLHNQDLTRAGEIQNHLLQKSRVRDKRFTATFFNIMAHEVGGDFFRVYHPTPDLYLIGCFDVAGKNISGAMNTMALGTCFATFEQFQYVGSSDKITNRINNLIKAVNPTGVFVAAVLFYVDFAVKMIRVHNCGFSPVMVFVKNENKVSYKVSNPNLPPLGVVDEFDFSENLIIPITKDLRICAYSDGLTDMADIYGERYGEENTVKLIKGLHLTDPAEIKKKMQKEVTGWIGSASLADDITFIDMRFN